MVRFAKEKDLLRVNELRRQVNEVHVEGRPDIFKPGFCQELKDYARRVLEDEDKDIIVVERDGNICGMACVEYIRKPESPYTFARNFYHVSEIAVDEAFQRQGVATELVTFMKEDAKAKGLARIELDVWEFNKSAIEFYEAAGFQMYRRFLELECEEA